MTVCDLTAGHFKGTRSHINCTAVIGIVTVRFVAYLAARHCKRAVIHIHGTAVIGTVTVYIAARHRKCAGRHIHCAAEIAAAILYSAALNGRLAVIGDHINSAAVFFDELILGSVGHIGIIYGATPHIKGRAAAFHNDLTLNIAAGYKHVCIPYRITAATAYGAGNEGGGVFFGVFFFNGQLCITALIPGIIAARAAADCRTGFNSNNIAAIDRLFTVERTADTFCVNGASVDSNGGVSAILCNRTAAADCSAADTLGIYVTAVYLYYSLITSACRRGTAAADCRSKYICIRTSTVIVFTVTEIISIDVAAINLDIRGTTLSTLSYTAADCRAAGAGNSGYRSAVYPYPRSTVTSAADIIPPLNISP